jgi:Cysteine-rich CPXCG
MQDEISYICDSCGEEIVIPFDFSQGSHQSFVEDCPVCCHPNQIDISVSPEGHLEIENELE